MDQVKQALADVGYAASPIIIAHICALLKTEGGLVKSMVLDGPPGAGKTALAKALAKMIGCKHYYMQAYHGITPEHYLYDSNIPNILRGVSGDREAVKSASDVIDLGFIPKLFVMSQRGRIVGFLDEADKSGPNCDALWLAALQEGEVFIKGIGRIRANLDNLILFFTKNDERDLSEPLMRRCRRMWMSFPDEGLEMDILTGGLKTGDFKPLNIDGIRTPHVPYLPTSVAKVLVAIAQHLRKLEGRIRKAPATQELEMAGRDAILLHFLGATPAIIGQVAASWLVAYKEDMPVLLKHVDCEKLGRMLSTAVKASGINEYQHLPKVSDNFVTIGDEQRQATEKAIAPGTDPLSLAC